ncbi:PAS domain S-box-containing protein/diguanylate cyclase (GGDEF)-like protein [Sphaerotilus hippei]|uniref:PAS domain S-box-containing protein/diguanylate cyclase (GGDEF)-like protein n=1 Tax=Sphaerotilus hippei TaxID=744406 RepID=A0A318GZW6_9BURK|nr:EAL domain-containing protein [Sphaerotilus hippei]PXW95792.1 PAS domain S-box-containing protein/diguanylate cyclase (GGDEF)-like protein [Sphaerotilus hippei]
MNPSDGHDLLPPDTLRQLVDSGPLWLAAYDQSLVCVYANDTPGQPARPGRSITEVMGDAWTRRHAGRLREALAGRRQPAQEEALRLPDGRQLQVEIGCMPCPSLAGGGPGLFLTLHDLTRHHELERALVESEERLARFMQASMEGILFHRDGLIADANPALCELLGHTLHELLGRPWLELVAPEQRQRVHHLLGGGEDTTLETTFLHQDGSRLPVELIDRSTLQDGQPGRMAIVRDVRDRHAAQARLHYLAHHDALTGLPNHPAFMGQLEHLMVTARAAQTQLALLFIDLDHFKRVNDSVGHTAGDTLLKVVAHRIGAQLRSSDRVARFGGDEFMVLLPGLRERGDVLRVADKLLASIAEPFSIEGGPISVTASLGAAIFPQDGDRPELLIQHADAAMHVAKAQGRAGVALFEQEVAQVAYDNLVLEGQLGQAIEQNEFTLLFQPQLRTSDQQIVGVEALIRWHHPERGLLAPDEFIALAEQHRLIVPIGQWVLAEATRCAQRWHAQGRAMTVAVNLSTLQFQAPGFVESIERLLRDAGLPTGWLELELTERMLMDDVPTVRERLHQLRALGVKLSVDDFGTGYSSLGHLKDLPIDKMKIDRSFVHELPQDRQSCAIARAIIELARGLGLTAVAEGVETGAQRAFLEAHGCHQLQGMGISPPLTAERLEAWLQQRAHPGA